MQQEAEIKWYKLEHIRDLHWMHCPFVQPRAMEVVLLIKRVHGDET
jgi:hypothetical protein